MKANLIVFSGLTLGARALFIPQRASATVQHDHVAATKHEVSQKRFSGESQDEIKPRAPRHGRFRFFGFGSHWGAADEFQEDDTSTTKPLETTQTATPLSFVTVTVTAAHKNMKNPILEIQFGHRLGFPMQAAATTTNGEVAIQQATAHPNTKARFLEVHFGHRHSYTVPLAKPTSAESASQPNSTATFTPDNSQKRSVLSYGQPGEDKERNGDAIPYNDEAEIVPRQAPKEPKIPDKDGRYFSKKPQDLVEELMKQNKQKFDHPQNCFKTWFGFIWGAVKPVDSLFSALGFDLGSDIPRPHEKRAPVAPAIGAVPSDTVTKKHNDTGFKRANMTIHLTRMNLTLPLRMFDKYMEINKKLHACDHSALRSENYNETVTAEMHFLHTLSQYTNASATKHPADALELREAFAKWAIRVDKIIAKQGPSKHHVSTKREWVDPTKDFTKPVDWDMHEWQDLNEQAKLERIRQIHKEREERAAKEKKENDREGQEKEREDEFYARVTGL